MDEIRIKILKQVVNKISARLEGKKEFLKEKIK